MIIIYPEKKHFYELVNVVLLFLQGGKHFAMTREMYESTEQKQEDLLEIEGTGSAKLSLRICLGEELYSEDFPRTHSSDDELFVCVCVYKLLSKITGKRPKWGVLTGIRPVKLVRRLMEKGLDEESISEHFVNKRLVDEGKLCLAKMTAKQEMSIISRSTPDSYSLYIGIPFCPTRCSYCSFVSQAVSKAGHLIQPYLDCLLKELDATGSIARELGLKLRSVYIGGGTPTTLNEQQLKALMEQIQVCFPIDSAWEYTVEAGRPDTINEEKLRIIKSLGATRISINPQSLQDSVLRAIGRPHTGQDVINTFELARKLGFDNINADIIAGLPTDTFEGFSDTLHRLCQHLPENITVHSLAIKRSSEFGQEEGFKRLLDFGTAVEEMVEYSQQHLISQGYTPYYLYRQKNIVGNQENVGYTRNGFSGIYNTYSMDETHTILACGAGAGTKLKKQDSLERIFNFKFPYEYISGFDQILERKTKVRSFYGNSND